MLRYTEAICREIQLVSQADNNEISVYSIYLGGGTPSLLPAVMLDQILTNLRNCFHITADAEITMEANPGTLSPEYLAGMRRMGINRLSIGMQSGSDNELRMLGRIHSFEDVRQCVYQAHKAGFDNLSLDLIYGLPGQTLQQWRKNLHTALEMNPEHLSLYALTLEPHVRMAREIERGCLPTQDDDLTADMYETATDELEQAGFEQYEISNWAKQENPLRDLRSRHNLQYWLNLPYLGFGAGAHGCAEGVRTENISRIIAYCERCLKENAKVGKFPCGPALKSAVRIDRRREMQETLMLGLRLREGVSADGFCRRFGEDLSSVFGREIEKLKKLQLLEPCPENSDAVRLTRRGRFLSNIVFREFVD